MKVAYVILHYLALNDTTECVNSILNNIMPYTEHEIEIVVVDNGSPNNSYEALKNKFFHKKVVHFIHSEKNQGFAKGNNLGFQYAKNQLHSEFIILMNNDTIIEQKNFTEVLVNKYKEKKYYVLGPDIITADGYHQNPGTKQSWNLNELRVFRFKKRMRLALGYLHLDKLATGAIKSLKEIYRIKTLVGDTENTILHGACLIFSPEYVRKFEGLYPETFLYMEEDILKLYADYYGFLMLYSSDLQIYHKEDVATNMVQIPNEEKVRKKDRLLIQSSKIYSNLKRRMIVKKAIVTGIEKVASKAKTDEGYRIDLDIPLTYLFMTVAKRVGMLMRGNLKKIGMKEYGKHVFCGSHVKLKCKSKMKVGNGVTFQSRVYIDALSKTGVTLGNGASIGTGTVIRCSGNMIELGVGFHLGNHSSLADNCFVGASGGVYIGDDVIGGQNIRFHSSNHVFMDLSKLIRKQGITKKGIKIGNNCWIGAGAVFCDGVTIGDGCVIGANAVITRSFPENSVIAGNPAKLLKQRL